MLVTVVSGSDQSSQDAVAGDAAASAVIAAVETFIVAVKSQWWYLRIQTIEENANTRRIEKNTSTGRE